MTPASLSSLENLPTRQHSRPRPRHRPRLCQPLSWGAPSSSSSSARFEAADAEEARVGADRLWLTFLLACSAEALVRRGGGLAGRTGGGSAEASSVDDINEPPSSGSGSDLLLLFAELLLPAHATALLLLGAAAPATYVRWRSALVAAGRALHAAVALALASAAAAAAAASSASSASSSSTAAASSPSLPLAQPPTWPFLDLFTGPPLFSWPEGSRAAYGGTADNLAAASASNSSPASSFTAALSALASALAALVSASLASVISALARLATAAASVRVELLACLALGWRLPMR